MKKLLLGLLYLGLFCSWGQHYNPALFDDSDFNAEGVGGDGLFDSTYFDSNYFDEGT